MLKEKKYIDLVSEKLYLKKLYQREIDLLTIEFNRISDSLTRDKYECIYNPKYKRNSSIPNPRGVIEFRIKVLTKLKKQLENE